MTLKINQLFKFVVIFADFHYCCHIRISQMSIFADPILSRPDPTHTLKSSLTCAFPLQPKPPTLIFVARPTVLLSTVSRTKVVPALNV